MEPEKAEEEEELFQNIKETRQGAGEHNKTPGGYATAWLNADRGRILGPSRSQEVQEGDSIELNVFGKYVDPKKVRLRPAAFVRTGLDQKIIRTLGEYGQNLAAAPNEIAIANVIALVITELQQKPAPEAYMGYALYDSDSILYEQGKVVLSKKARNKHEELIQKLSIKKDGYIETFLVNETSENVWFDQFRIMSTGPLIVQETHYDPWGVELSGLGYQYGGIKVNPYLYNSKEANGHLGVNWYDYGARMYDPAIGRWFVVDPMAEVDRMRSPFTYALNNPLRYIDPDGMVATDYLAYLDRANGNVNENSEQKSAEECERCTELPEVVVTETRIIDFSSVRSQNYLSQIGWNNFPQGQNNLGIDVLIQPRVIGGTVPFLPGGIGGWGNIRNLLSAFKNFRSILRFGKSAIPSNRLHHIFGKSEHALEGLVEKFGTEAKAFEAVQKAANLALKSGKLTPNSIGILPSGNSGNVINVGGLNVRLIGGRVENGKVVISSFSRKGF
ncbi:RHS repeat-associated core domain-containing protein [Algoriphagus confluentis]|uniref:RHS repeat-associated core domain-containing protein n=1 Tax=Algoriphagus confluentis TaxID=1697556 RepID=A0ABQ6PRL2_9BACT|nr:hypothetical protein Aconfl_32790 [Algoriphagus confluentis]